MPVDKREAAIERMARAFAEYDGNDPDQTIIEILGEPYRIRGKAVCMVSKYRTPLVQPLWQMYRDLALVAVAKQNS